MNDRQGGKRKVKEKRKGKKRKKKAVKPAKHESKPLLPPTLLLLAMPPSLLTMKRQRLSETVRQAPSKLVLLPTKKKQHI